MQSKAANLTFPLRLGTSANTPVRYYDCNSGTQATALPADWYGKFVIITNDSANAAQFYISDDPASACDETIAASASGGGSVQLGGTILGNTSRQGRLPSPAITVANNGPSVPKTYYLVRASVAAATLRVELAEQ